MIAALIGVGIAAVLILPVVVIKTVKAGWLEQADLDNWECCGHCGVPLYRSDGTPSDAYFEQCPNSPNRKND